MTPVTWRTDEPCPVCGTGLTAADTNTAVRLACGLCGWSDTWHADPERTSDGR